MASGVPVITTRINGLENFDEFLFIMEEEKPKILANLIISLSKMNSTEQREFGIRAFNYVAKEFSWDEQGKKILKFLRSL